MLWFNAFDWSKSFTSHFDLYPSLFQIMPNNTTQRKIKMDLVRKRQKLILGIDIRQRNKQGRVILCKSFAHFFFSF